MKIIFFGTPHFVVPVLQTLAHSFHLVGVVTAPDRKVGRHGIVTPSPVKTAYQSIIDDPERPQAQVFTPETFSHDVIDQLTTLSPDLFVTAAYGKILPKEVLSLPTLGSINIHPSLLPQYRGPSPIQATILAGDRETGVSFMLMDEKIDHGPLLTRIKRPLDGTETFDTLSRDLFQLASAHIRQVLTDFVEGKNPTPQDDEQATFCKPITKQDGFVDPANPPTKTLTDRMIRAYYPWPGAWTRWENKVIKLYPNDMVQLEGKNPVSTETFLRGYPHISQEIRQLLQKD